MTDEHASEVKDVERVEIEPAEGDDDTIEAEETAPESSQAEETPEGDAPPAKPGKAAPKEQIVSRKPAPEVKPKPDGLTADDLKEVPGETPRERALRLEVTRLRGKGRTDRIAEIAPAPANSKTEPSPESKKVLERYKPEQIAELKEVFGVMAEDMGFVRKDQIAVSSYTEKANAELDTFLTAHPEYLPENDPDSLIWNRFKEEYGLYKQPANPKDFQKIFNRIHTDIFGIKPSGGTTKVAAAAQEKKQAASHTAGASGAPSEKKTAARKSASGLRTDMLKGFSDEELADLEKDS